MKEIKLKWKTGAGHCIHKKNNEGNSKEFMRCFPNHCPYFEECKVKEEEKLR